MRGHTKSLDANDKLIQTRSHVRNAIASRERQVVMRKVKSTILSSNCMPKEEAFDNFCISCCFKTSDITAQRRSTVVSESGTCLILSTAFFRHELSQLQFLNKAALNVQVLWRDVWLSSCSVTSSTMPIICSCRRLTGVPFVYQTNCSDSSEQPDVTERTL